MDLYDTVIAMLCVTVDYEPFNADDEDAEIKLARLCELIEINFPNSTKPSEVIDAAIEQAYQNGLEDAGTPGISI